MDITWQKYRLPLDNFRISKGTFQHRNCLIVKLAQGGLYGLGETTEISYYDIRLDEFEALLTKNYGRLNAIRLTHPIPYYEKIKAILGPHPFLLSAIDGAAWDLYGKMSKKSTRDIIPLGKAPDAKLPATSFTIGLGSVPYVLSKIDENPWPVYKIKLGGDDDLTLINHVCRHSSARLRIDANGGWTSSFCQTMDENLTDQNIEFIEQPLPHELMHQMPALKKSGTIKYIADESCQGLEDVAQCAQGFNGINIKLMKCGGITNAIQMIKRARDLGLEIMIGCMTESSIGISAAAQLLPWVDYADLDGAMLIKEDIATGVTFDSEGQVKYVETSGHGCKLASAQYAS